MIFKKGYIFQDTKDNSKIKIIDNFSVRKRYYIRFKYLANNNIDYALRDDLLYFINKGVLKYVNE